MPVQITETHKNIIYYLLREYVFWNSLCAPEPLTRTYTNAGRLNASDRQRIWSEASGQRGAAVDTEAAGADGGSPWRLQTCFSPLRGVSKLWSSATILKNRALKKMTFMGALPALHALYFDWGNPHPHW